MSSLGFGIFGATLPDASPLAFWGIESVSVALLVMSPLSLAFALAFDVMLLCLIAFAGLTAWSGTWGALISAAALGLGLAHRGALRGLLSGTGATGVAPPIADISKCVSCGRPAVGVLAPALVVSSLVVAVRTHGLPRPRCLAHARRAAIPATLLTLVMGWWSIWGLFWTPSALYDNLINGGVESFEGSSEAEAIARIGWLRYFLPLIAFAAGVGNWVVASRVADRVIG